MLEIRLSEIEVDSGAVLVTDPALVGGGAPIGLFSSHQVSPGHYTCVWKIEGGPSGKGRHFISRACITGLSMPCCNGLSRAE